MSLHEGQVLDDAALREYAVDRLGGAAPRVLFITPKVPRSVQGKLIRGELLDLFQAQVKGRVTASRVLNP